MHRTSLVFLAPFLLHTWFCLHLHFLSCAFHGMQVLQRMVGAYCRMHTVFHSAFTQRWVWMTFVDPVRVKLSQLRSSEQEMEAKPCNRTCWVYEVPASWLRWGVWLCVGAAEAVVVYWHKQVCLNCFTVQLHQVLEDLPVKAAVLLNCCVALLLFSPV